MNGIGAIASVLIVGHAAGFDARCANRSTQLGIRVLEGGKEAAHCTAGVGTVSSVPWLCDLGRLSGRRCVLCAFSSTCAA